MSKARLRKLSHTTGIAGLSALFFWSLAACKPQPVEKKPEPVPLRVLSWNIHHGEGLDSKLDLERIAARIREWAPHLVALQEVDAATTRSGGVDQAAELARLTGMAVRFASSMDWGGGKYGLAILGPESMSEVATLALPNEEGLEPRIAASVDFELAPGLKIRFVNTHLTSSGDALRLRQCEALTAEYAGLEVPLVLAGDLNSEPGSPELLELGEWLDAGLELGTEPTIPAEDPSRRIDFVAMDRKNAWKAVTTTVPIEPVVSDHRPVLADLEITPEQSISKSPRESE